MAVPEVVLSAATVPRLGGIRFVRWARSLELWLPAAVLVLIVLACFLGPAIFHLDTSASLLEAKQPPLTPGHLLGTDALGNDLLSQSLRGGQVSIAVGLGSVALGIIVGAPLGVISGFAGGAVEAVIMRILDAVLAFPALILALVAAAYLGPSEQNEIFAIAFFTVPAFARLTRATTLEIRKRDFVLEAELGGGRIGHILVRHVVPNISGSLLTYALLSVGEATILEATLSFLGLGVQPPTPSWGNMIALGQPYLSTAPWIVIVPGVFLFLTVLSLNLVGDALRTRWDA